MLWIADPSWPSLLAILYAGISAGSLAVAVSSRARPRPLFSRPLIEELPANVIVFPLARRLIEDAPPRV